MSPKEKRDNLKVKSARWQDVCKDLVCQHYKQIYRFTVYLTKDENVAEDLTQETFACAWENFESYKGNSSVETWLHKIAYHKFIDLRRRLQCNATVISKISSETAIVSADAHPLRQLMVDEELGRVYEAMRKLEADEYLIILLHYIQGLSFAQMGEVLEQATGTIKWKTNQTLKKLRAYLCGEVEL